MLLAAPSQLVCVSPQPGDGDRLGQGAPRAAAAFDACFQLSSCCTREIPPFLNVASVISELFPSLAVIAVGSQWDCWQEQDICSFW